VTFYDGVCVISPSYSVMIVVIDTACYCLWLSLLQLMLLIVRDNVCLVNSV